jgi:hypothetical protein
MPDKRHGPKSRLRLAIHHRAADLDIGQTGSLHAQLKVSHGLLELRKRELAIGSVDLTNRFRCVTSVYSRANGCRDGCERVSSPAIDATETAQAAKTLPSIHTQNENRNEN